MNDLSLEPLAFKFHWLGAGGQPTSMFRKKGGFDGEVLTLEDVHVPAAVILQVEPRDNRMVIAALTSEGEPAHLLIQLPSKSVAAQLKTAIDIARSKVWAGHHKEQLSRAGRGHEYRDETCPHCSATLVLSSMPETPQLYCHYCSRLTTVEGNGQAPKGENQLRLCDECGLYSRPQKFTIGYIVFLLVFVHYSYRQTRRCPACMRPEAWKMLAGNLPTLLGTPLAFYALFRCYTGGMVGGDFKGLDTGNIKARKGDFSGALGHYRAILDRVPHCAGVKYNLGLTLRQQGKLEQAADSFRLALNDCSNYSPAYHHLRELYEELGRTADLEELKTQWEDPPTEDEAEPEDEPPARDPLTAG